MGKWRNRRIYTVAVLVVPSPAVQLDMAARLLFLSNRSQGSGPARDPSVSSIPYGSRVAWWRHQMETFSALLAICAGNSPVPGYSPQKGQWRGTLMFSLICVWINDWVNNREAGDLRRDHAHDDVTVMGPIRSIKTQYTWRFRYINTGGSCAQFIICRICQD